ncbi:hypothetical protein KCP70_06065 [Salmonella enterica subsp. enterica]|nr:hypothetical protein KCP70_06065 [Salmonella enterica subsp. enterica]
MSTGTHRPAIMVFPASFWITTLIISSATIKKSGRRAKHQRQRTLGANPAHGDCGPTGRPATTIVTMRREHHPPRSELEPLLRLSRTLPTPSNKLRWAKAIPVRCFDSF